jgi:hypothetical protein
MKTRFISLILPLLFLVGVQAFGQLFRIESMFISPSQPTTSDVVKLVVRSFAANSPCRPDTVTMQTNGNQLLITQTTEIGMMPATCTSTDTFYLGTFPQGSYELILDLRSKTPSQSYDTDTLFFNVTVPTEVKPGLSGRVEFRVFPNPANEFLEVSGGEIQDLILFNNLGQKVENPVNTNRMHLQNLLPGIYHLQINGRKKTEWRKVVVE